MEISFQYIHECCIVLPNCPRYMTSSLNQNLGPSIRCQLEVVKTVDCARTIRGKEKNNACNLLFRI
jgi:hypothetical protein